MTEKDTDGQTTDEGGTITPKRLTYAIFLQDVPSDPKHKKML